MQEQEVFIIEKNSFEEKRALECGRFRINKCNEASQTTRLENIEQRPQNYFMWCSVQYSLLICGFCGLEVFTIESCCLVIEFVGQTDK